VLAGPHDAAVQAVAQREHEATAQHPAQALHEVVRGQRRHEAQAAKRHGRDRRHGPVPQQVGHPQHSAVAAQRHHLPDSDEKGVWHFVIENGY
jgi:hypothetical protein